jgi:purine nucleosidase
MNLDHGAGYGDTLSWSESDKPKIAGLPIEVQTDLNLEKFYNRFVDLLTAPTPKP